MKKSVTEIEGFHNYLLDQGKRQQTIQDYIRHITHFSQWLDLEDGHLNILTRYDIQQYMKYLQDKGNQAATIHPKFSAIVSFAKYIKQPQLTENIQRPQIRQSKHISPQSLSRTERNRLFRELERSGNHRSVAIAYVLLYTGLRVSELVALDQENVLIGKRSGHVVVRDGKGGIARTVPLPSEARFYLCRYLEKRQDYLPALFLSNYQKRISKRSVQRIFEKWAIHPHLLRHTYGRELVASGVDIATVAELMGHRDVNVTRRYAAPSMKDMEQAVEQIFG